MALPDRQEQRFLRKPIHQRRFDSLAVVDEQITHHSVAVPKDKLDLFVADGRTYLDRQKPVRRIVREQSTLDRRDARCNARNLIRLVNGVIDRAVRRRPFDLDKLMDLDRLASGATRAKSGDLCPG
jgi:hypothetical protein